MTSLGDLLRLICPEAPQRLCLGIVALLKPTGACCYHQPPLEPHVVKAQCCTTSCGTTTSALPALSFSTLGGNLETLAASQPGTHFLMARAPARARAEFENYIDSVQLIGTNGSSTNAKQPYNTVEQLRYYWTAEKIKQALNVPSYISHHISAIQERYPRVFSVLVLLEKAEFIQDLISEPNFEDPHLPFFFSRQHPPHRWPFGKEEFSRFYNLQWRFSVRDLDSNRLMSGPNFDKEIILPFIKSEPLKPGDSAATCKVEVDTAHNRITTQASNNRPANAIDLASRPTNAPEIQFKNVTTNCFVLKTYRTNKAKKYYEKEVSAFGRLMHPDRYVENIITFYGSWIHGDTYNILLEYADRRTLLDYYRNVHPPTRIEDITQFWTRLFDTVKALHCIHQLHDSGLDGPTVLQGYRLSLSVTLVNS